MRMRDGDKIASMSIISNEDDDETSKSDAGEQKNDQTKKFIEKKESNSSQKQEPVDNIIKENKTERSIESEIIEKEISVPKNKEKKESTDQKELKKVSKGKKEKPESANKGKKAKTDKAFDKVKKTSKDAGSKVSAKGVNKPPKNNLKIVGPKKVSNKSESIDFFSANTFKKKKIE